MDGLTMIRTLLRRSWPGLCALACLAGFQATPVRADPPIPVSTSSTFYYRCDVKCGTAAFARPAGPWYSYFPIDPNLLAQPRASAFPNWPTQLPAPAPLPPPVAVPPGGMSYYQPAYPYAANVYPAGYQAQPFTPAYWYGN
jgi:hypothetical protein